MKYLLLILPLLTSCALVVNSPDYDPNSPYYGPVYPPGYYNPPIIVNPPHFIYPHDRGWHGDHDWGGRRDFHEHNFRR